MPLDSVHAYRLVRLIRVVMPLFVVLLVALLVWNLFDRTPEERVTGETAPRLVEELADLTEELRYRQFEGERTVLDVQASRNLGFRDGRNLLSDVSVTVHGESDGEPERIIHSERCGVVQETGDMDCDGNVEFQLDPATVGRTSAMRYVHATRTITTLDETEIVRRDQFRVRADQVVVRMAEDELRLLGQVQIESRGGTRFASDRASFFEANNRVEAAGSLHVISERGELKGVRGEADLDPVTFSPYRIRVWEGVSAQSFGSDDPSSLTARELEMDLKAGNIRDMLASGEVALESGAGTARRTLTGDFLRGSFDAAGGLVAIEARSRARMAFGPEERLSSRVIRNELPNLVTTLEDSLLDVGDFRVEGSDFRIERGDRVRFSTGEESVVRLPSGFTRGQRTDAEFDPSTNMLIRLVQTGSVEFELGGRSGSADRVDVESGGDRIVLLGRPTVSDASVRIDATQIDLDQRDQSFRATGSVRTVSGGDDPVLVRSEVAEGDGDRVRFTGSAELWRGSTHVSASQIDVDQRTNGFVAEVDVASTLENARIWADRLEFDDAEGVVHYLGNVRVETEDMNISADDLVATLVDGQPDRIVATGDVRLRNSDLDGRGDTAVYLRSSETVVLSGQAAEISDSETGLVQGRRFDIDVRNKAVTVTTEDGGRVISRRVLEP